MIPSDEAGTDASSEAAPGDGALPVDGSEASTGDAALPASLPLGTVTDGGATACPSDAASGAACKQLVVHCGGLPDITARAAITVPSSPKGTVFMIYGGGGTAMFNGGPTGGTPSQTFPAQYVAAGFRVVQVEFATAWEDSPRKSIKAAACRPATLVEWAFESVHAKSRTEAFCAHGHSGGSGSLGYALADYGLGSVLDHVIFDAGPVFGRIDDGCDPALTGSTSGARAACTQIPAAPFAYGPAASLIDTWEGTSTCEAASPPPADQARWAADSIVSSDGRFDYPQTDVSFWWCSNNPNASPGQGSFLAEKVTSAHTVNCVGNSCSGEIAWTDTANFAAMVGDMTTGCVPRH